METDDEEAPAGEAEGEARILGIVADGRIPGVTRSVQLVQGLELAPEKILELLLAQRRRPGERGHEGSEGPLQPVLFTDEGEEVPRQAGGGSPRSHLAVEAHAVEAALQGCLGSGAGKPGTQRQGQERVVDQLGHGRQRARRVLLPDQAALDGRGVGAVGTSQDAVERIGRRRPGRRDWSAQGSGLLPPQLGQRCGRLGQHGIAVAHAAMGEARAHGQPGADRPLAHPRRSEQGAGRREDPSPSGPQPSPFRQGGHEEEASHQALPAHCRGQDHRQGKDGEPHAQPHWPGELVVGLAHPLRPKMAGRAGRRRT